MSDGGGVLPLGLGQTHGLNGACDGNDRGLGEMRAQPVRALGQSLRMGIDRTNPGRIIMCGQKHMLNTTEQLGVDIHGILQKKIQGLAHTALQGIFQRNDAQIGLARSHGLKHSVQIGAGREVHGSPQMFQSGLMGKRTFGTGIGYVLRLLQTARRR
jgi:hypothetical protein